MSLWIDHLIFEEAKIEIKEVDFAQIAEELPVTYQHLNMSLKTN